MAATILTQPESSPTTQVFSPPGGRITHTRPRKQLTKVTPARRRSLPGPSECGRFLARLRWEKARKQGSARNKTRKEVT